jgi:tRNA pseudouridine55 synthase
LARDGKEVELDPRKVTIYDLKFISYKSPDLSLEIECSAGTYIRSIAHDLGERLSTGAHLAELRRIKSGPFTIKEAIPLPKLEVGFMVDKWEKYVVPAVDALPEYPIVKVDPDDLGKIQHGHRIAAESGSSGIARAVNYEGNLIAILEAVEDGSQWHPKKVFIG